MFFEVAYYSNVPQEWLPARMINLPAAGEKKFPQEWLVENDQKRAAGAKNCLPQEWLVKMISLDL